MDCYIFRLNYVFIRCKGINAVVKIAINNDYYDQKWCMYYPEQQKDVWNVIENSLQLEL